MLSKILKYKWLLIVVSIFIVGLVIRLKYSITFPITNDEGAYLYDARNILNGLVPYRDFLTKSLPTIFTLAFLTNFFGDSYLVGRLLSIFMSVLVSGLLYILGKELFDKKVGILSAAIFWAFPSIAAYTSLLQLQPYQQVFVLASIIMAIYYYKKGTIKYLFLAGFLGAIAFFVRISSIYLLLLIPIVLLIRSKYSIGLSIKRTVVFFFGFLTIFLPVSLLLIKVIGIRRMPEVLGYDLVKISVADQNRLLLENVPHLIKLWFGEVFLESQTLFVDSLPFLVLAMVYTHFLIVRSFSSPSMRKNLFSGLYGLGLIGFILFLQSYYRVPFDLWKLIFALRIETFIVLFGVSALLFIGFSKRDYVEPKFWWNFSHSFLVIWAAILSILFVFWIKFRSPYLIEFMPILVLVGSSTALLLYGSFVEKIKIKLTRKVIISGISLFTVFAVVFSYQWNYRYPFTGTHNLTQIKQAVTYLREVSTPEEEVVTGSLIIPFMAGRRVPFNISHPSWYGYNEVSPDIIKLFMPPFEEYEKYVIDQKIRFVIMDQTTYNAFFEKHRDFYKYFQENYESVKKFERVEIFKFKED